MHILFIIANNSTVPYFSLFMQEAAARGTERFSFVAMTPTLPGMVAEAAGFGFKGYWVPFDETRRKVGMLRAMWRLYRLFSSLRPDVVHSHLFDDSLPAMLAARLAGVQVRVVTKQDTGFHYHYARKWVVADRFINWNATHVVPPSREALEFVRDVEGCNPDKLHMIHHGISTAHFSSPDPALVAELRKKFGLADRFVIGTVARLIEWKGFREIVKVAKIVAKQAPETLFVWAGTGPQLPLLQRLVKENDLESHILLAGNLEVRLMPSLYGAMDVYLHAAVLEPFGFVIAEAMMAGLPVVSTPTGAARDAIEHGVNGWLGRYGDPESLAEGILHYRNSNIRRPFAPVQKTAREMYDFKLMYQRFVELYGRALTAARRG